jgi:two-component system KDP operon response regulator KdpE
LPTDGNPVDELLKTITTTYFRTLLEAADGESGIQKGLEDSPSLIILDLMLPDIDGFEVCRRLRQFSNVPVLMLTAKGREVEKVKGLELGADDYMTKPFSFVELLARVRALLRRANGGAAVGELRQSYERGGLKIDFEARKIYSNSPPVDLTQKETDILHVLVRRAGQVVGHKTILSLVWGSEYTMELHYLKPYIHHLRKKLQSVGGQRLAIINVPREGYKFIDTTTQSGVAPPRIVT